MAKTAMKEADEVAAIPTKDFERAIRIMRHDVKPAEENKAESRGDLSAAWAKITDECGCNSAAAKVFRKQCLEASDEKKDDFLRTLRGLLMASGISISRDLVDMASDTAPDPVIPVEGVRPPFPPAPQNAKPKPHDDAELDGVVGEVPDRGGLTAADVEKMDDAPLAEKPKRAVRRPNLVTVN